MVRCDACQTNNTASAKFCTNCGARLPRQCPACSFVNLATAKFCTECGTALDPTWPSSAPPLSPLTSTPTSTLSAVGHHSTDEAERRIVTVLFADVARSTEVAEKLDPEEFHAIINQFYQRFSECITRHDGTIDKYIGDSVMALFGAPLAHENDPERAVRAALEMQAALHDLNSTHLQRIGISLAVRIGINSGEVIAGHVGSEARTDYTVIGDAVNVASRLQHEAPIGGILVGESIYAATRWAFNYEELPPLQVKGKSEKIVAHRCLGLREQPLAARGLEGVRVPMLGRDAELRQLCDAFETSRQGQPQIVSLIGDAGIGKSRLAREFTSKVVASGLLPAEQCWTAVAAADCPQAFGVARQIFASAVVADADAAAAGLRDLLEFDPGAGNHGEDARYLDPEARKQRLYLLARDVLAAHANGRPLLVVVEDLHWADESSLDLLRFLATRPDHLQLMFLFTHRPAFRGVAISSTPASVRALALSPLPRAVALQLLRTYFGDGLVRFSPAFVDTLLQRSEGNPFFLEELARSLVRQGALQREDYWQVPSSLEQLVVPASIRGLLLASIDRLDAETRRLLQEASVLGQTFPARQLASFTGIRGQLDERLRELVQGEWLAVASDPASGDVSYHFPHELVREVVYDSLLLRARVALHRRSAEVIEAQHVGHLDEWVPALAEHYYRAHDEEKGVIYLTKAGERALAMYANAEAATYYRRALKLIPEARADERARGAVKLGDALYAQGAFDEAVASWQGARDWYESNNVAGEVVALCRRMAHALWAKGRVDDAQVHLMAALRQLESQPDTPEAAALYQELANQWLHRGDSRAAIEWARRALDLSQRLRAYQQASLAAISLGVALARGGEVERGQRSIEQALHMAKEHDLPAVAARAACNLAVLYANCDPLRAAEICEQGLAEARRIGYVTIQPWFCATLAGSLHACASDYETATSSAKEAIELDRQIGLRSHLPIPLIVLAQIDQCHGRLAEAEAGYQEALARAEELGDPQLLFPCLEGLGTLCVERGEKDRGLAYLEQARRVCERAGFSLQEMVLLPFFY